MNITFSVLGIRTGLIRPGEPILSRIRDALEKDAREQFQEGDVLVIAESALATAEGRVIPLDLVLPTDQANQLAVRYHMDPRVVEVVLGESDEVVGGIQGFLLCMKHGTLLPNAGVDASNAPPGCIVPLPADPDRSAREIRADVERQCGVRIGVIVADSRTHAMRVGCSGVAIGCAGIPSVIDDRGRSDLFGRRLEVTRRAVADNIASAAELVMGEADEGVPAALVRGLGLPVSDQSGIETIDTDECLFMGLLKRKER